MTSGELESYESGDDIGPGHACITTRWFVQVLPESSPSRLMSMQDSGLVGTGILVESVTKVSQGVDVF